MQLPENQAATLLHVKSVVHAPGHGEGGGEGSCSNSTSGSYVDAVSKLVAHMIRTGKAI